jgi:hypothetical protein
MVAVSLSATLAKPWGQHKSCLPASIGMTLKDKLQCFRERRWLGPPLHTGARGRLTIAKRGVEIMTYMQFVVFALVLLIPLIGQCDVNTDLIEAAKKGDIIRVKTSLDKGANVNAQDKDGGHSFDVCSGDGLYSHCASHIGKKPQRGYYG